MECVNHVDFTVELVKITRVFARPAMVILFQVDKLVLVPFYQMIMVKISKEVQHNLHAFNAQVVNIIQELIA